MKTNFHLAVAAFFLLAATALSSCKKDKVDPEAEETEFADVSQDEADFSGETDQLLNDADLAVFNQILIPSGRSGFLCGADLDTTSTNPRVYTITFDGTTPCNGRVRSGKIVLTLYNAQYWRQAGAVLGVEMRNLHVKRVADNRQFNISGSGKIYNVRGGLVKELGRLDGPDTVEHRIRFTGGRMNGHGGTISNLNIAKTRLFMNRGQNHHSVTTRGDTTIGNNTVVGVWGQNRGGKNFMTRIIRPLLSNSECGWFRPVSGKKQHVGFRREIYVTFGVNQQGVPVNQGGAQDCAFGYLVEWVGVRGNQSRVIPYR